MVFDGLPCACSCFCTCRQSPTLRKLSNTRPGSFTKLQQQDFSCHSPKPQSLQIESGAFHRPMPNSSHDYSQVMRGEDSLNKTQPAPPPMMRAPVPEHIREQLRLSIHSKVRQPNAQAIMRPPTELRIILKPTEHDAQPHGQSIQQSAKADNSHNPQANHQVALDEMKRKIQDKYGQQQTYKAEYGRSPPIIPPYLTLDSMIDPVLHQKPSSRSVSGQRPMALPQHHMMPQQQLSPQQPPQQANKPRSPKRRTAPKMFRPFLGLTTNASCSACCSVVYPRCRTPY